MTDWLKRVLGIKDRGEREKERQQLERELDQIDFRMRLAVGGIRCKMTSHLPKPPRDAVAK